LRRGAGAAGPGRYKVDALSSTVGSILAAETDLSAFPFWHAGCFRNRRKMPFSSRVSSMQLPARLIRPGLTVGLLGCLACGGNPSAPTPTLYDGTWRGTTSQMCAGAPCTMVFTVASNEVTGVYTWARALVAADASGRVSCDAPPTGSTTGIGQGCLEGLPCGALAPPVPISGTSFSIVGRNFGGSGIPFVDTMTGAFASPTSASGSLTFTIRAVCVRSGSASWTATKQ